MGDSFLEIITERVKSEVLLCDKCSGRDWGKLGFSCGDIFLWVGSK